MYKYVIFDLDDTLYNERQYVECAMLHVSEYFGEKYGLDVSIVYRELMTILDEKGRGKVFDFFIEKYSITEDVANIVRIYRQTRPHLNLYEDAKETIMTLKRNNVLLGIITDGCSEVQHHKIEGLNIIHFFDDVIVTDDYENAAKPSRLPYSMILNRYPQLNAEECIYVGDNPNKDFMGARAIGMATARIVREKGDYMKIQVSKDKEADYSIKNLTEILEMMN